MLPKHQRLTSGRDYKRVYQKGSFFSAPLFSLNWLPNKTSQTRIGFVIGKKIAAKAVERNALKRKYREATKSIYNKITPGFDVIIVIREKSKNTDFLEIQKSITEAVEKIK